MDSKVKASLRVLSGPSKKVKRTGTTLIEPGRGSTEQMAEPFWSDGCPGIARQDSEVGWYSVASRDKRGASGLEPSES